MHAVVAGRGGGPEVLSYVPLERPVPGAGQLLIKVAAAGVKRLRGSATVLPGSLKEAV